MRWYLEYYAQFWSHSCMKEAINLERVQRGFSKCCHDSWAYTIGRDWNTIGLHSLEHRSLRDSKCLKSKGWTDEAHNLFPKGRGNQELEAIRLKWGGKEWIGTWQTTFSKGSEEMEQSARGNNWGRFPKCLNDSWTGTWIRKCLKGYGPNMEKRHLIRWRFFVGKEELRRMACFHVGCLYVK